eukprot:3850188-Rhodomonas_salina.2
MSGTDLVYGLPGASAEHLNRDLGENLIIAMQRPVAQPGTDLAGLTARHVTDNAIGGQRRGSALASPLWTGAPGRSSAIPLRACYALSGTDIADGAPLFHLLWLVQY